MTRLQKLCLLTGYKYGFGSYNIDKTEWEYWIYNTSTIKKLILGLQMNVGVGADWGSIASTKLRFGLNPNNPTCSVEVFGNGLTPERPVLSIDPYDDRKNSIIEEMLKQRLLPAMSPLVTETAEFKKFMERKSKCELEKLIINFNL